MEWCESVYSAAPQSSLIPVPMVVLVGLRLHRDLIVVLVVVETYANRAGHRKLINNTSEWVINVHQKFKQKSAAVRYFQHQLHM
jgi:hypothetical protein